MDDPSRPNSPAATPRLDRRAGWLDGLDAALAGLVSGRPLAAILAEILRSAVRSLGASHGFLERRAAGSTALGHWPDGAVRLLVEAARDSQAPARHAVPPLAEAIAVEIRDGTDAVGTLAVGYAAGADLADLADRDGAAELLQRFARIAAVAIENDRLVSTERAAREQEHALRAATQALSATLRLQEVLAAILSELQNVVPHDTASVQQLQGDRMVIVGGRDINLEHFLGFGFPAYGAGGPNSEVLRTRRPVIVADILGDHPYPDFPHTEHALSGVRSWLGVPLLFGSSCTGMLTLDKREPGFYTEAHAEAALAFAAQAAIALENARLYEQSQREVAERRRAEEGLREANRRLKVQIAEVEALEGRLREQAIRDPLTGLYNRRYFSETLQRELARCRRDGAPLCLALLDLDHFKEVNDAWGHDAGDHVLEAFGLFLRDRTRDADFACRYGGEEFVILLPGASGGAARARAETWRADLERLRVHHDGRDLSLTMSIGIAEYPAPAKSADDLLKLADVALYQAKREGRNRIVLAR